MNIKQQKGFTLVEVAVVLALITIISLYLLGPVGIWMAKSSETDTDRKLQELKMVITRYYDRNAMAIDNSASTNTLGVWTNNKPAGRSECPSQLASFQAMGQELSESAQASAVDGFKNPWCILVSPPLTAIREGVTLTYRNIALVSTGHNGVLDTGSQLSAAGMLELSTTGDDRGILISGLDIQHKKLLKTLDKMQRIANLYETYFTTQYLSNANRDMSINYFNNVWYTTGQIGNTGGSWSPTNTMLSSIGVSGVDGNSEWETNNNIEVGNYTESANGITARTPATTGTAAYPYTALIRAAVPGTTTRYVSKIVVGNY